MTVTAVAAYGVYIAVLNLFTPPTAVYWTADIVYGLTLWLGGDSGLASGSSSGLSQRSGRWVLMRLRRSVGCAQRPSTGIVNLQTMNFYILSSNCFHRRRSCFSSVTAADAKFE